MVISDYPIPAYSIFPFCINPSIDLNDIFPVALNTLGLLKEEENITKFLLQVFSGSSINIPATVSLDLNVDTCDNPNELSEVHFTSYSKYLPGKARASRMIQACLLHVSFDQ